MSAQREKNRMEKRNPLFLVVDDQPGNLISLKALIGENFPDAPVILAQNGMQALEQARARVPDVVLLDIMMPDMDGFEVCRRIKADPVLKDVPVMFVTALKSDRDTRQKALLSGGDTFLNKPIDEIELFAQLNVLLKVRESNLERRREFESVNQDLADKTQLLQVAEESVRESEVRFRSFVEQSPVCIGIFGLDGIGQYANRKFLETLGLERLEAFVGRPADEFLAPGSADESKERTRRRLHGLPAPLEFDSTCVRADGTPFPAHLAVAPIELPSGVVSIAFLTDITERVQAEAERHVNQVRLAEESVRYRALVESTNDWIWVVDAEQHRLVLFNSAVADYHRKNHQCELKRDMKPEAYLSPRRVAEWEAYYERAVREGRFTVEYRTGQNDLRFLMSLSPLVVEDRIVGISVFGKDMTAEAGYQEKLETSNRKLTTLLGQSIAAMSRIVEMRDVYTAGHQKKVAALACAIARELGM